jgi:tRNA-Thr(GGU) m(6)t(6)A37 methyltransferase TsaA
MNFTFEAIGVIRTPFRDKFGVPRQPGLVPAARGIIELRNDPDLATALRGIDSFSHLWLVFVFHVHDAKKWKPSVRPPRLGGAKKMGVLASRSPHRPNPIGLSAVKLESVDWDHPTGPRIEVSGIDLVDGTPILDLKPYIPYADSFPNASAGWASAAIDKKEVLFDVTLRDELKRIESQEHPRFRALVTQLLSLDPRPAYQARQNPKSGEYGFWVFDYDVKYRVETQAGTEHFHVFALVKGQPSASAALESLEDSDDEG